MKTNLVQIGKSQALRISKDFLQKAGIKGSVHVTLRNDEIIITAKRPKHPRAGWAKAFREAIREHGNEYTQEDIEWLNAPLGPLPENSPAQLSIPSRRYRRKA